CAWSAAPSRTSRAPACPTWSGRSTTPCDPSCAGTASPSATTASTSSAPAPRAPAPDWRSAAAGVQLPRSSGKGTPVGAGGPAALRADDDLVAGEELGGHLPDGG